MSIVLTIVRVLVGLAFIASGLLPKLIAPAMTIQSFERWGLPAPEVFVPVVGVLELVCGAALVLGVLTRYAAILLAANMVGAVLTAGLVDGGMHLVAPPILAALSVLIAVLAAGASSSGPARAFRAPHPGGPVRPRIEGR